MSDPHIVVSYVDTFPQEGFARFKAEINAPGLNVLIEPRPEPRAYATLEWLIPTAVVAYIAKPYFESFLKEMGKDHYLLLKNGLKNLGTSFLGKNAPRIHVISTKGKADEAKKKYSLAFSIVAELETRTRVKLLLDSTLSEAEYTKALEEFLAWLKRWHNGVASPSEVRGFVEARPIGGTVLIAFNAEENILEVIDPVREGHAKNR